MSTVDEFNFSLRGIKILLGTIIVLFMLTGAVICVICGVFSNAYEEISDLLSADHYAPILMLMIVGILIFAVSCLGLYGVVKENTSLIFVFLVCLIIAVLIELGGALWLLVIEDDMMMFANTKFRGLMSLYENNREAQMTIKAVQSSLNCCGAKGPGDWRALGYKNFMDDIPEACCSSITRAGSSIICTASSQNGCINAMAELLDEHITGVVCSAISILVIQLMGIIFATILGKKIRSQKTAKDMRIWHIRNIYLADKNIYQPLTNSETYINFQNI